MGPHYRRWVRLLNEGKLEAEFEKILLNQKEIDVFTKYGVVTEDHYPQKIIKGILKDA